PAIPFDDLGVARYAAGFRPTSSHRLHGAHQ
ncbi:MAG TPA: FAD dependent oxidoreductase, partial [Enterobacteriaceae bacterium]|nr:FAD dependent oxidoreductase [Enterobacteriaceae bacterium]